MFHNLRFTSPAQTLDIVGVDVCTLGNRFTDIADFAAIFYDVLLLIHITHGDFMSKWHIIYQFYRGNGVSIQGHGLNLLASLQVHSGYADIVTATTHKAMRGPRGGMILSTEEHAKAINKAVFPGYQGGAIFSQIAGKAVAFLEAMTPEYQDYAAQIIRNAQTLAATLQAGGLRVVSGGTDNHLMLLDLRSLDEELTGKEAAVILDEVGITLNRNAIPNEPSSPFYPSGLRIGTPLVTTRGMKEAEMKQIGRWIAQVTEHVADDTLPTEKSERREFLKAFREKALADSTLAKIRREVNEMATQFPLFQETEV